MLQLSFSWINFGLVVIKTKGKAIMYFNFPSLRLHLLISLNLIKVFKISCNCGSIYFIKEGFFLKNCESVLQHSYWSEVGFQVRSLSVSSMLCLFLGLERWGGDVLSVEIRLSQETVRWLWHKKKWDGSCASSVSISALTTVVCRLCVLAPPPQLMPLILRDFDWAY